MATPEFSISSLEIPEGSGHGQGRHYACVGVDDLIRKKLEAWQKASKFFDNEMPKAIGTLKNILRKIIENA